MWSVGAEHPDVCAGVRRAASTDRSTVCPAGKRNRKAPSGRRHRPIPMIGAVCTRAQRPGPRKRAPENQTQRKKIHQRSSRAMPQGRVPRCRDRQTAIPQLRSPRTAVRPPHRRWKKCHFRQTDIRCLSTRCDVVPIASTGRAWRRSNLSRMGARISVGRDVARGRSRPGCRRFVVRGPRVAEKSGKVR